MATTIKDIAKAANVSYPAVSATLNNKNVGCRVSPATRERILRVAREMDYKPNFSGLLLRGEKTKTVALLISQTWHKSGEYMKDLIIALMSQFDQQGYACYFSEITGDGNTNYSKVLELISRGVHHFIFLGSPNGQVQIKELIESKSKSYVVYGLTKFMNRHVESDSASGVASIIRFFLSRGKGNFRMLMNPRLGSRLCGLRSVFPDMDLETLKRRYVVPMDKIDTAEANPLTIFVKTGYDMTAMILEKDPAVQAIFYLSDPFALGGAKFLFERGFTIGRDILLAGFNETFAVKTCLCPISSVEHDIKKIAETIIRESLTGNTPFKALIPTIVHIRE